MLGAFKTAVVVLVPLAFAGVLVATACSQEQTETPTCVQDVSKGKHENVDGGCNPFAVCRDGSGNPVAANLVQQTCCKDQIGTDLENCLYGYGVGPAPSGSSVSGSGGGGGAGGQGGDGGAGGAGGQGGNGGAGGAGGEGGGAQGGGGAGGS